ncbi:MAG TPA: hypothetical protein PLC83_14670, partial [Anaerolineaceae bacterium]|nr:hypothetical protein [Anaerolineaceae bacterium]
MTDGQGRALPLRDDHVVLCRGNPCFFVGVGLVPTFVCHCERSRSDQRSNLVIFQRGIAAPPAGA